MSKVLIGKVGIDSASLISALDGQEEVTTIQAVIDELYQHIRNLATDKASVTQLTPIANNASSALQRLSDGRASLGWDADNLSLNFYIDGVFISNLVKTT